MAPFETLNALSKDPTNTDAWGDALVYTLPLLKVNEGITRPSLESSLRGGSRDISPLRGENNCAGCTIAGDASLKGNPASAINHGVTTVRDFLKEFGASKMDLYKTPQAIVDQMSNMKEGTTGVIFGDRGPGQIGHFFNVTKQNGVVQFMDFQRNVGYRTLNPETIMQEEGFKQLYFLNTTTKTQ